MVTVRIFFGPGAPGALDVAADEVAEPAGAADADEAPLGARFGALAVVIGGALGIDVGSAALAALLNDGLPE
jgi:hypothetical protein